MRTLAFILKASLLLGSVDAKGVNYVYTPNQTAQNISSHKEPASRKIQRYWQRVKYFFAKAILRVFPAQDALYYIVTILVALFIPPLAILIAGLWVKDDKWWVHVLINSLIILLAIILFFITCGFGLYITWAMILGAFIHAIWYIIDRGNR